jgi:hypothetical protein
MTTGAVMTSDDVARWWGFAPDNSIAAHSDSVSAAIWRFDGSVYDLQGHADENTDVISMPIAGHHHHTYFADGRQKWARTHPPFHMNLVAAGEKPRGIFVSARPFTYLHVYVPHAMIDRLAVDNAGVDGPRRIALIDPMCSARSSGGESLSADRARDVASGWMYSVGRRPPRPGVGGTTTATALEHFRLERSGVEKRSWISGLAAASRDGVPGSAPG